MMGQRGNFAIDYPFCAVYKLLHLRRYTQATLRPLNHIYSEIHEEFYFFAIRLGSSRLTCFKPGRSMDLHSER